MRAYRALHTHCNTLQHTVTHYNILQHTATHCNTLQHTATHCSTLHHTATHCNTLLYAATHCCALRKNAMRARKTLQHNTTHYNTLQHSATHCSTPQHTATHRNTLQHTATHCNTLQHTWDTAHAWDSSGHCTWFQRNRAKFCNNATDCIFSGRWGTNTWQVSDRNIQRTYTNTGGHRGVTAFSLESRWVSALPHPLPKSRTLRFARRRKECGMCVSSPTVLFNKTPLYIEGPWKRQRILSF